MRKISIVNPAAGQGDAKRFVKENEETQVYITQCVGDAENFVYECCSCDPECHFFVYGGDGTINEVVNGIMRANAQKSAILSIIPVGTGNDLLRSFPKGDGSVYQIDTIKYNDKYAINVLNTGFDAAAAKRAGELKKRPFISGSAAYLIGVLSSLGNSYGQYMNLTFTDETGNVETLDGEFLLCAVANCSYYGGGFKAAPAARYDDGLLDVLLVNKVSRPTFFSVISAYKAGKHIDPETGLVYPKYNKILQARRCKSVVISGIKELCIDGEIQEINHAEITILKKQIRLMI